MRNYRSSLTKASAALKDFDENDEAGSKEFDEKDVKVGLKKFDEFLISLNASAIYYRQKREALLNTSLELIKDSTDLKMLSGYMADLYKMRRELGRIEFRRSPYREIKTRSGRKDGNAVG